MTTSATPDIAQQHQAALTELETVVEHLVASYERLGELARRRHEAVRRADPNEVTLCIEEERTEAQHITALEPRRAQIVRTLAEALGSPDAEQTTLTWIAQHLGGESGDRLASSAERLRDRLESVRQENEVVRRALTHLGAHMEGLWRQAASVLNHARTYGRGGAVEPGPKVVSSLDLTS